MKIVTIVSASYTPRFASYTICRVVGLCGIDFDTCLDAAASTFVSAWIFRFWHIAKMFTAKHYVFWWHGTGTSFVLRCYEVMERSCDVIWKHQKAHPTQKASKNTSKCGMIKPWQLTCFADHESTNRVIPSNLTEKSTLLCFFEIALNKYICCKWKELKTRWWNAKENEMKEMICFIQNLILD